MISKKISNKAAPFDVNSYILGFISGRRKAEVRRASAEYEEQQQAPEVPAADQDGNEADAGK